MIQFTDLQAHLKKPALYERTAEKFWNDPHIAAQMLAAHLDPYTDAASRKPEFIGRCADWVAALLPEGASLLDIGSGPGLYTKQFAKRGLRVTGLDFSESSVAYAREHDPDSEYILQDYLSMDFKAAFDMITLIYYDYGALIPDERANLLRRIHKALKPGGLFLFDIYTPLRGKGKNDRASWDNHPNGGFWSAKPHICLSTEYVCGEAAEGHRHVVVEENSVRSYNLWDCYFTRQSILGEADPFGFSEYGFFNDAAGQPSSGNSETLCAILKKES
ncbi:MAG: class I SAM-dependent methyltransferase [Oscillospiraceae bacterium]|nr:class I SAM-dependent methyltransferase [Oscillospiraceae bacterium]